MPRVEMSPSYPSDAWQLRCMDKLISDIREWKLAYYNSDGQTVVDDATYDLWWANLMFMEKKYPHLVRANSPTTSVGAPLE